MNILITGATGFVGTEFVKRLSKNPDYNIFRVVRKIEQQDSNNFYIKSIDKNTDWSNVLKNIDVVVHLAAKVHDMQFTEDNRTDNIYYQVNSEGTNNLLKYISTSGVKKIVFLSTIKVNGENPINIPFKETDKVNPIGSYSKSKSLAEQYIIEKSREYEFKYTIIRPTLILGPNVKGNLMSLMKIVKKGFPFPFFREENRRSLLGLRNLSSLIEYSMGDNHLNNEVVIASDREMISTRALIKKMSIYMDKKLLFIPIPGFFKSFLKKIPIVKNYVTRLYDSFLVDNSKLLTESGWTQEFSIDEEIEYMVKQTRIGDI